MFIIILVELTRNFKPIAVSNSKEYLGIRKGSFTSFDEMGNIETTKNSENKLEINDSLKNEITNFSYNNKNNKNINNTNSLIEKQKNSDLLNDENNKKEKSISLFSEKKIINNNNKEKILINENSSLTINQISNAANKGIVDIITIKANFVANSDCNNSKINNSIKDSLNDNTNLKNKNYNHNDAIETNKIEKKLNLKTAKSENKLIINTKDRSTNNKNNYYNDKTDFIKDLNVKENCACNNNLNNIINNDNYSNYHSNNSSVEIIKFLFEDFLDFKELINILKTKCNSENNINIKFFEEGQENPSLTLNNQQSTNISEKSINNKYNNNNNEYNSDNNYLNSSFSRNDNNSGNFFDDVYTKFNNLSKKLASKRKSVCIKLYNILKALVN